MESGKKNSPLIESVNGICKGRSSHLWIKHIIMYGIIGFIAFVFTHMFAHSNLFYIESDSAQYLLSALVQSQAAIIGIIITLNFIAVQLIFSYSPRAVGVALKRNYGMWMLLTFYGVSIFYGLSVLRMIPNKSDVPLSRNTDFLTLWGSTASIECRICLVYCLGIFTFVAIAPYLLYTVNFLKPDNIIKILSHDIIESKILKHIKSVEESEKDRTMPMKDDPVQPIADIIYGSVMKYDIATTRTGINIMADRAIETIGSVSFSISGEFEEDLNRCTISKELKNMLGTKKFPLSENAPITKENDEPEVWRITDTERTCVVMAESGKLRIYDLDNTVDISKHFCNHLRIVGECTVSGGGEGPAIDVVDSLKEIGTLTIEMHCDEAAKEAALCIEVVGTFAVIKRRIFVVEAVMDSLGSVGKSAAKNRLGDTTSKAIDSIRNVGMHAAENKVETATRSAVKYLGSIGKCAAENGLKSAPKQAADSIGVVGNYAADNKLKCATSEAALYLGVVGISAAEEGLEDAAEQAVQSLGHVGKTAERNGLDGAVWQSLESLGQVGMTAAEKGLGHAAASAAMDLRFFGKFEIEKGNKETAKRAIWFLEKIGTIAAEKGEEFEPVAWQAAESLGLVGRDAAEKGKEFEEVTNEIINRLGSVGRYTEGAGLEKATKQVAQSFIWIGVFAVKNGLTDAAQESAKSLAAISNEKLVAQAIHESESRLRAYGDSFQKFLNLYEHELKEPHPRNSN